MPKIVRQSEEKPCERVSPNLVMLMSCCDFDLECLNISFHENELDGIALNSNGLHYCIRKNGGKVL